jgi:hypothetical protein
MQMTQVVLDCIKTAYVERLNATLRTWMPALPRRTRTPSGARNYLKAALFWTGCIRFLSCDVIKKGDIDHKNTLRMNKLFIDILSTKE